MKHGGCVVSCEHQIIITLEQSQHVAQKASEPFQLKRPPIAQHKKRQRLLSHSSSHMFPDLTCIFQTLINLSTIHKRLEPIHKSRRKQNSWYQKPWDGDFPLQNTGYCYDVTWNAVFSCPTAFLCDGVLSVHTSAAKSTWLMIIWSSTVFAFNPNLGVSSPERGANMFYKAGKICSLNRICSKNHGV